MITPSAAAVTSRTPHPRGIYTLYFLEMWERMSYYGMRSLLVLFMTAETMRQGMGLEPKVAAAIYGLYTCAVYLVALPGGWIADRLLGAQRSVMYGGMIIALGHFTLAIPDSRAFFLGLLIVVMGTALLKPNASAMVGQLYPEGGSRRDAGFTLFYMGVNLGAFIGPLVCGGLRDSKGWHWGFGAAGVGMVAGVIQYWVTRRHLGAAGLVPANPTLEPGRAWAVIAGVVGLMFLVFGLAATGVVTIDPLAVARHTSAVILTVAVLWFGWAFFLAGLTLEERKRIGVVGILFITSALFWSGFEQMGSSMSLFAEKLTDRHVFGWNMPAEWFQSINAFFILLLAPACSALWLLLDRKGRSAELTVKMAWGLLLLGAGFVVMYFASLRIQSVALVAPWWLVTTYLLHTIGELFLSPVGLSAVTKLSPPRLSGQMMGVWFLATALGNLLAGLLGGHLATESTVAMPGAFLRVASVALGAGTLLWVCSPWIRRLMPGVK